MALAACFATITAIEPARSDEILVSAAASLTDAFNDIGKAYSAAHPGTVVEVSDVSGPKGRFFDLVKQASVDWDGSDPVRRL